MAKIARLTKRSEGSLLKKALQLGIRWAIYDKDTRDEAAYAAH